MKATVNRKDLSEALTTAAAASSTRTALPVLSSIRIDAMDGGLTLLGCDGEMWAQAKCQANIEIPGAICVPQRLLSEIVGALPDGHVEIELNGTSVFLRHGVSEWRMLAMPAEDFPPIPASQVGASLTLTGRELRKGIEAVVYAVSDDTSRPMLTGVLFSYDGEVLTMVATDTHRMAVHRIRRDGIGSRITAIVPEKALKAIKNLTSDSDETITLGFDETRVRVEVGNSMVTSQLLSGQYPNWERVVPTEFTRAWTLDRQELLVNVNRAMILARDSANRVRFKGEGDRVVISARSEDKGDAREEVGVVSKNGDIEIAFNGRYVMDALKALDSDGVQAEMTESSRPAVLRPTDSPEETFCVVMPMAVG